MRNTPFCASETPLKDGDIGTALSKYENIVESNPADLDSCYKLAELYARRGLISRVAHMYLKIADIYLGEPDGEKSLEICRKIIRLQPENIQARERMIEIYRASGNKDKVRQECFQLSRICSMLGHFEKAVEILQKGIEVDPHNIDARLELAGLNIKQGSIKEGFSEYKEVALSLIEQGNLSKAVSVYERMIVLQPDDIEIRFALGRLYREVGKLDDARKTFRYILRYDLSNIKALEELGRVCQEKGEIDSAVLAFKKIVSIEPEKIESRIKLADLYEIRGQISQALITYYNVAEEYYKRKEEENGKKICEKILHLDCRHSKTLRLIKKMGYTVYGNKLLPNKRSDRSPVIKKTRRLSPEMISRPRSGIMLSPGSQVKPPVRPARVPLKRPSNKLSTRNLEEKKPPSPLNMYSTKALTPFKTRSDENKDDLLNIKSIAFSEKDANKNFALIEFSPHSPPADEINFSQTFNEVESPSKPALIEFVAEESTLPLKKEKPEKPLSSFERLNKFRKSLIKDPNNTDFINSLAETLLEVGLLKEALKEYEKLIELKKDSTDFYEKIIELYNILDDDEKLRNNYIKLGELYKKNNNFISALDIYQRLISLDKDNLKARTDMAHILLLMDKKKEALYQYIEISNLYSLKGKKKDLIDIYRKILEIDPESAIIHRKLAKLYEKAGMRKKAALEYVELAEIYMNKKSFSKAAEIYDFIVKLVPDSINTYLKVKEVYMKGGMEDIALKADIMIADIYIDGQELELAEERVKDILLKEPENFLARERLIEIDSKKGSKNKAAAEFKKLADLHLFNNRTDEAIKVYERLLSIEPENYTIHYRLIELYKKKGQKESVINKYLALAYSAFNRGEWRGAFEAYERLLAFDRKNIRGHYGLGVLLSDKMGKQREAVREFEFVKNLDPSYEDVSKRLFSLYVKLDRLGSAIELGKEPESKEAISECLELYKERILKDPKDYEARYKAGFLYKESGELQNAIEQFQALLKCPKKLLKAYNMLGLCFEQMGFGNIAIKQFKKGLALKNYSEEDYLSLRYNLGLLYERRGMDKEAFELYKSVFAVNIKYRDVNFRFKKLKKKFFPSKIYEE